MTSRFDLRIAGEPSESHEKAIKSALAKYLLEDPLEKSSRQTASWSQLEPEIDLQDRALTPGQWNQKGQDI